MALYIGITVHESWYEYSIEQDKNYGNMIKETLGIAELVLHKMRVSLFSNSENKRIEQITVHILSNRASRLQQI